jgi:hypothetical protein
MSKIGRMCVLVASLMSFCGVMSSTAGAVTWSNDGGTSFTATGGPRTFSGGGLSLSCASSDATGTAATGPFTGAIWVGAASMTATYTGCTVAGITTHHHCAFTFTAAAQSVPTVTNGNLDVTCDMTQGATKLCHFEGSTAVHYITPPDARFILTESATLRTTSVPPGNCPLGNGGATTMTQQIITLTSPNPPTFTRRP